MNEVVFLNPASLKPYKLNAKKHPQSQIKILMQSLQKFGPDQPIVVDKDYVIIKGHGRRLAAMELGWSKFPVVIRDDLSEAEARAARLADNKSSESGWDFDILKLEIETLDFDIDFMGLDIKQDFHFTDSFDVNDETCKKKKRDDNICLSVILNTEQNLKWENFKSGIKKKKDQTAFIYLLEKKL